MTYCDRCGMGNREGSRYCNGCGESLDSNRDSTLVPSWLWTASGFQSDGDQESLLPAWLEGGSPLVEPGRPVLMPDVLPPDDSTVDSTIFADIEDEEEGSLESDLLLLDDLDTGDVTLPGEYERPGRSLSADDARSQDSGRAEHGGARERLSDEP